MKVRLRPLGFIRWVAPRRPTQGIVLVVGLLLAYAHNQLQEVALRTTLEVVRSMFRVELQAPTVSASLFRGEVVLSPLRAEVEGREILRAEQLQVRLAMDWSSMQPRLEELVFQRPEVRLDRRDDGTWNLEEIFDTEALTNRPTGQRGYRQEDVPPLRIVDGSFRLTGPHVRGTIYMDDIDLVLRHVGGDTLEVEGEAWVRRRLERPEIPRNHLHVAGQLQTGDEAFGKATGRLERGELDLLEAFLGSDLDGADGDFEATVNLKGPLSSFDVSLDAQIEIGSLRAPLGEAGLLRVPELHALITVRPEQPTRALVDARRFTFLTPDGCPFRGRTLDGRLRLREDGVDFEEASFRWGEGRVSLRGDSSLGEGLHTRLEFSGDALEAEPLSCLIHDDSLDLAGTFSVPAGTWSETTASRNLELEVAAADLTATLRRGDHQVPLELRSITGHLRATTSVVELVELEANRDTTQVTFDGPLWQANGEGLDLAIGLADLPLRVPTTLMAPTWSESEGLVGGDLRVRARRGTLDLRGGLRIPTGLLRSQAGRELSVENVRGNLALRSRAGVLQELEFQDWQGSLHGAPTTGTLRHVPGAQEFSFQTTNAPLDRVLEFVEIPALRRLESDGIVFLEARGERSDEAASLQATLRAQELPVRSPELGATTLGDVVLGLEFQRTGQTARKITISEGTAGAFGGSIDVRGTIQEDETGAGVALELSGKALDTATISTMLDRPEGRFEGIADFSGSLEGPLETPRLRARVVWERPVLVANFGEKPVRLFPDQLDGALTLTPGKVQVGPLRGQVGGGPFSLEFDLDLLDQERPWRLNLGAKTVDMARLVEPYLKDVDHDLYGQLEFSALLHGKGPDPSKVAAGGSFEMSGGIRKLQSLLEAEKKFKLQNLHDIGVETFQASLGAAMGTLNFRDIELKTTHGSARGEVGIGLDGTLSGEVRVALDRMILTGGHRLVSQLEGGRYFNFQLHPGGTLAKPDYGFKTRAGAGALVTGAVLFSPVAAPAAIFMGLKNLLGGNRRPRRLEPKPLPPTTPAPTPDSPTDSGR